MDYLQYVSLVAIVHDLLVVHNLLYVGSVIVEPHVTHEEHLAVGYIAREGTEDLIALGSLSGPIAKGAGEHIVMRICDILAFGTDQLEAILALESGFHAMLRLGCHDHAMLRWARHALATGGHTTWYNAPGAIVAGRRTQQGDRKLIVLITLDLQCGAMLNLLHATQHLRGRLRCSRRLGDNRGAILICGYLNGNYESLRYGWHHTRCQAFR